MTIREGTSNDRIRFWHFSRPQKGVYDQAATWALATGKKDFLEAQKKRQAAEFGVKAVSLAPVLGGNYGGAAGGGSGIGSTRPRVESASELTRP